MSVDYEYICVSMKRRLDDWTITTTSFIDKRDIDIHSCRERDNEGEGENLQMRRRTEGEEDEEDVAATVR